MSDTAGPRDDRTVDSLLRDAGFDDDVELLDALQDLRGLAGGQPEPSAAVAALMVPAGGQSADRAATRQLAAVPATRHLAAVPATAVEAEETPATPSATPPSDELAARRRTKRRITLTTLSVAVSLAAGGAVAVASDQGIRDSIGQVNQAVSSFVAGVGGGSAPAPVDSPVPLPAQPGAPATVPAAPAAPEPVPAAPAAPEPVPAAPGSGSSQLPQQAPDQPGKAGQQGSAPAVPLPDLPVPDNLAPGLPGVPDAPPNREGQPPALPLPSAPPVQLPGVQQ